jgi:hypothetical protein
MGPRSTSRQGDGDPFNMGRYLEAAVSNNGNYSELLPAAASHAFPSVVGRGPTRGNFSRTAR